MSRTLGALCVLCWLLSACSIFFPKTSEDNRKAYCKELNHRMMYNGATSDQVQATQQRAEMGTLTQSYNARDC